MPPNGADKSRAISESIRLLAHVTEYIDVLYEPDHLSFGSVLVWDEFANPSFRQNCIVALDKYQLFGNVA